MHSSEESKTQATSLDLNHVDYLLKNPFAAMEFKDQLKVKRLGAHQSKQFTLIIQDGKILRTFQHHWFNKTPWLSFSKEKNSLFCFYCLLFGGDDLWTKTGSRDLKHLSGNIESHSINMIHLHNAIVYKTFGHSVTETADITAQCVEQHNGLVDKHRHVLSSIVDCLKFCEAHALTLQGIGGTGSSNGGTLSGLVKHTAKLDNLLNHCLKNPIVAKYAPETTQNELLECCRQVYLDEVRNEVKGAQFVSIRVDESPSVACRSRFAIVLRYLKGGKPVERFVAHFEVVDRTAKCFTKMLIDELKQFELNDKLVAQAYDGATSAMISTHGRVEDWMKEQFPHAKYVHCCAHPMDAVVSNVCSSIKRIRIFFARISGFGSFLASTGYKMLPNCVLNSASCNSYGRIVKLVAENRTELVECFERMAESEWDGRTVCDSSGLLKVLQDDEFLFLISFFSAVFEHTEILYNATRARFADELSVECDLQRFISAMTEIRDNLRSVAGDGQLWAMVKDEHSSTSIHTDVNRACDEIICEMKNRFQSLDLLCSAVSVVDPKHFSVYKRKFPRQKVLTVTSNYPMLNREKLGNELTVVYAGRDFFSVEKASELFELLVEMGLIEALSEVHKLLEIVLVTPVSTADTVQCFDMLSNIKAIIRNTVETDRLDALVILSVHKEFILEIENFNRRVVAKFASQEGRTDEFMYR